MATISFNNKNPLFFNSLKEKIEVYFQTRNLSKTGNWRAYLKAAVCLSTAVILYVLLVVVQPSAAWSLLICALLGFNLAVIGFNVMHDGAHGSFSSRKWVNNLMGFSLNIMGGNAYIWKAKHNLNHHSFTNIEGMDDDIDIRPWIRTNENQPHSWYHRFQHIYCLFLYGMTYLIWVYQKDFVKYFTRKIADTQYHKMSLSEHFIFWLSKLGYLCFFVVLPAVKLGFLETLLGYAVLSFFCGMTLSIVFQLAHIVEHTSFPLPDENTNKIPQEWALHQIATTANFATRSKLVSWFVGGLNFQIEHHLFPKISHIHYPAISELVKETCLEFNVKYIEIPTLFGAVRSHLHYLKRAGMK